MLKTGLRNTRAGLMQLVDYHCVVPFLEYAGKAHRVAALTSLGSHVHPHTLEVVYLESGRQIYQVDGTEYEINGGDFFVTYPDELHGTGRNPEERSDLYWVGLSLNHTRKAVFGFLPETEQIRGRLRSLPRVFTARDQFEPYFERILAMASGYDELWSLRLQVYVTDLLFALIDAGHNIDREPLLSVEIAASVEFIRRHLNERITVDRVCEHIGLSRCYFQTKFREEVGSPPGNYILREKMKHAQRLLLESPLSVTDIAYELAFSSSQHFSAVFKTYSGVSPTEFVRGGGRAGRTRFPSPSSPSPLS